MKFRVVMQETARHETTILVEDCKDKERAKKIALAGHGSELSDRVSEWLGDGRVLSCEELPSSTKVYRVEEDVNATQLIWSDGKQESCIRTEYPMHHKLVENLLLEAGYSKVELNQYPGI